ATETKIGHGEVGEITCAVWDGRVQVGEHSIWIAGLFNVEAGLTARPNAEKTDVPVADRRRGGKIGKSARTTGNRSRDISRRAKADAKLGVRVRSQRGQKERRSED